MRKVTLIFPMAGQGARFGYKFKPFLDIFGRKFIDAAFAPFRPWRESIANVYFIFLESQERDHDATAELAKTFPDIPFEVRILSEPTDGPAQTLSRGLDGLDLRGPAIVSDCDHAIDVSKMMRIATSDATVDAALPTWSLEGEPLASWGVAAIGGGDRIVAIAEKKLPEKGETFRGVIGTYYFADIARPLALMRRRPDLIYVSDLVRDYVDTGAKLISVPIDVACFYGDPQRLAKASPEALALLSRR